MMSLMVPRRYRRSAAPALRDVRGLDRVFDDLMGGFDAAPFWSAGEGFTPRVDVHESDAEIVVRVELPGLEEKDFDISLEDDVLTLKGEKRTEHEEQREGYRHVETTSGSFVRKVILPGAVDPDAVKASFKNGVLTVTLAKPAEARPQVKAIPVTTA